MTRGSADSSDYDVSGLTNGELTISSGHTSETFSIEAVRDTVEESNETVNLGFGTLPQGVALGSPSTATVTINDPPPLLRPPAPSGFSVRVGGGLWMYPEWDSMDGADKYQVDSQVSGSDWTEAYTGAGISAGTSRLRAHLRECVCGGTYDFRVRADGDRSTFAAEWGPYRTLLNISITCVPLINFTAAASETEVDLSWERGSGIEYYRVFYKRVRSMTRL